MSDDGGQSELERLRRENERLREQNAELARRLAQAEQMRATHASDASGSVTLEVAREALRRSEALFRAVIERSAEAISLSRADGTALYRSPATARLLGWSPEELTDRSWMENILPEDRPILAAAAKRLQDGAEREIHLQFRALHRDGSVRWMEGSATNLLDDPDIGAIVGHFRDITGRKQQEAELASSELRYRRLIEDLPEPIIVHVDRSIAYANLAAARLVGAARPADLIGTSVLDLAVGETRAQIEARMARPRLEDGEQLEVVEQTFRRPADGREFHVEVKSIRVTFEGQAATLSIARDLTRRVEAERDAAKALAEADLRGRLLEAVLTALPVGVWIADATGRLTRSNPAAARIWGTDATSLSEDTVYRAFRPSTGEALTPENWALARTLRAGETIVAEAVDIERFDGTRGHVLSSTAPIRDDKGRMIGGVAVVLDVTESHAAERERVRLITSLDFERRRLGTLLERAPAFIATMRGPNHVLELANEALRTLVGQRDVLGKALVEALPEVVDQGLVAVLDEVLETGEPFVGHAVPVTLNRTPDGRGALHYFNLALQPIVEADGAITGVFVHGVDVTAASIAEKRVRAQFHGIPAPTYVWRRVERAGEDQFVLVDFNQAALTISEGTIVAHLGAASTDFVDAPVAREELDRCLRDGVVIQREMEQTLKSTGQLRHLFVTYAAAVPDLVIVHVEDVTTRVKLEQQLRQAQKTEAVGRLAGGVAHDFNNLLTVILSYSALGIQSLCEGDPLRADLVEIQKAGERAKALTRQLLAFSRKQVLQPRVLDLHEILENMRLMLGRLLGDHIEVTLRTTLGLGRVLADPGQLEQVVMNLAVNARDAMPDGGNLTIETSNVELDGEYAATQPGVAAGSYVLLAVSDTGTGMDAATRARVFDPFFTTKDQGTGLGLSTVLGIVEQSGGHVDVSSEPGSGSTFKIYLRRTDRAAGDAGSTDVAPMQCGSETILLVEDQDQLRDVARAVLRRNGYRVLEAPNGGEALRIANEFASPIHLLLTDVVMPRMSGPKLAAHLGPQRPEMRVLYTSGYTDDAILHHGVSDAGVAFLQKPFTPDALLRKVRDVLDARG